jgi:serine O-acetyltransferase
MSLSAAALPDSFLEELRFARRGYAPPLHLRDLSRELADSVLALLFPHFTRARRTGAAEVDEELAHIDVLLVEALSPAVVSSGDGPRLRRAFFSALPTLRAALVEDAKAICEGDPAATSVDEVIAAYPGFFALACHRIAHDFWTGGAPLFARLITEYAHRETGVDIHPGAQLGRAIAIDHGTGVVIGETAVLGDRVKLYQGVTLGALSVEKSLARRKRHPTIGNDVVIYANATILGGDTVVGDESVIGGNVWLTRGVPPRSVVTHATLAERQRAPEEELLEFNI